MKSKLFDILKKKGIIYTEQQMNAVLHKDGPALVLAVPGSGKTTTIMGRIANLMLNHDVNASEILAITFSRASAVDMTRRFDELFGDVIRQGVKFSTIHSFANTIVGGYSRKFNKELTLLQPWQTNQMIKGIYKDILKCDLTDEELEVYVTSISYIKNKMLTSSEVKLYERESKLDAISKIAVRYDKFKVEQNLYDYDDMLSMCLSILKENEVTLNYLRNKYKYIMLDEAQDTSKLQFEIIKLIAAPKNNCFQVADDDQTIYEFRGACPEMLMNVNDIFKGTKVYRMEQNFRSTKAVIEVANNVISYNKKRYEKNMFTNKDDSFESVDIVHLNESAQNEYIVRNLKGVTHDVALLYRNNLSIISLANALSRNGIDFCTSNYKSTFFNHWILKDIFNIINLINDKSDIKAFRSVYYKIRTYLNKEKMQKIANITKEDLKGEDVFQYILENIRLKDYEYDRILELKIDFKKARKGKVSKNLKEFLEDICYVEFLQKSEEKSAGYLDIVDTVVDVLANVEYANAYDKISELKAVVDKSANNKSNVYLSTLHGSKGLEFQEVYLLSVVGSILPSKTDLSDEKSLEADRRLFYVGITRAKQKLRILVPGTNPSIFIRNIKDKKLDEKCLQTKRPKI